MHEVPKITVTSLDLERIEELLDSDLYKHMPDIEDLRAELNRAYVIDPQEVPPGLVTMNSTVLFRDETTQSERELTLVYPNSQGKSNPVSILAPVGSALLGLSVGQQISWPAPGGRILQLRVLEVRNQPEANRQYHR